MSAGVNIADDLIEKAAHTICEFANGSCECRRAKRRPCEAAERCARSVAHQVTDGIEKTHSLRKRRGAA